MAANLLVVGHDAAPSRALRKLVNYAFDTGYSTDFVLLEAGTLSPPSIEMLRVKVERADVVIIGMSTPAENAAIEIATAECCVQHKKPFGFYVDTHGAFTRKHFQRFRNDARIMFVVSADEVSFAQKQFPNATIVASGNPLWGEYFTHADRDESRTLIGAAPNEYVVLAPGAKYEAENITVWSATIKAAAMLKKRFVVYTRHPGDRTPPDTYSYLVDFAREHNVRLAFRTVATDRCVPGADLVINGGSLRIHALARLVPVIDFVTPHMQDILLKETGSRHGYFFGSGAVLDVYSEDWEDLAGAMQVLQDHPTLLRRFQSTAVSRITERDSLQTMMNGINTLVSVTA